MTTPTDWRALCAELLKAVDDMPWEYDWRGEPVGPLAEIDEAPFDRARAALAQPEPQGPPKNCWLDDEPGLCPSPCVFDDPSEVIDSCVEARCLSLEGKPKEACKYYRTTAQPAPQGPTDEELHQLWLDLYAFHDGPTSGDVAEIARAVLTRWGRPAIEPVPVSEPQP